MNRPLARQIADVVSNDQLKQMFDNAKSSITNWTRASLCNKGISRGTAWNILAKDFDVKAEHHKLAKVNMIREFGEYLPYELKHRFDKKKKQKSWKPIHQEPIF